MNTTHTRNLPNVVRLDPRLPRTILQITQTINGKSYFNNVIDGLRIYSDTMEMRPKGTEVSWYMISEDALLDAHVNTTADHLKGLNYVNLVVLGTSELSLDGIKNIIDNVNMVVFLVISQIKVDEAVRVARIVDKLEAKDKATVYNSAKNITNALKFIGSLGCERLSIQTSSYHTMRMIGTNVIDEVEVVVIPMFRSGGTTYDINIEDLHLYQFDRIHRENATIYRYQVKK